MLVLEPRSPDEPAAATTPCSSSGPAPSATAEEFYADSRYGELWVGVRPTLEEIAALSRARRPPPRRTRSTRSARTSARAGSPSAWSATPTTRWTEVLDEARGLSEEDERSATPSSPRAVSELRLVKDEYEIEQMRLAVRRHGPRASRTSSRALAEAVRHAPRRARRSRASSSGRARLEGNGVGYDTIAAAGDHACTLHWIRNDGEVRAGDLVLIDAGVEVDSLYTADVTRTLPVSGTFTEAQRRVYEAVLEAADAALRGGPAGRDVPRAPRGRDEGPRRAARRVGLLPEAHRRGDARPGGPVPPPLDGARHEPPPRHRRPRLRAGAPRDVPGRRARAGHGLHHRAGPVLPGRTTSSVPEEFRGIGVRIEDDVLVTEDGCENLSAMLPRRADDVEAWMARLR